MLSGPLVVAIRFINPTRGDIDNLVKTVLDALQGVAFVNDSQVVKLDAAIIRDRALLPCTIVEVCDGEAE